MTPHQLGQALRQQVLLQRQRTGRIQGSRLVSVIRDLCADEHPDFCAPLCFLATSAAFASALDRHPSLQGSALLHSWNQELRQIYASGLCQRLQPVLAGLLNLPSPTTGTGASAESPPRSVRAVAATASRGTPGRRQAATAGPPLDPGPAPQPSAPAAPHRRDRPPRRFARAKTLLVTALAFLGGVLLPVALALVLGIGRQPRPTPPASLLPPDSPALPRLATRPDSVDPAPPPQNQSAPPTGMSGQEPALAPGTTASAEEAAATAQQRAISSVQQLYAALGAKDYERARSFFSAEAADQFEPGSLESYEQVSIQDLRVSGQSGNTVQLEGVVSLVQADGNRLLESRSFSVDVGSEPPIVTASAFGRVLR